MTGYEEPCAACPASAWLCHDEPHVKEDLLLGSNKIVVPPAKPLEILCYTPHMEEKEKQR